MSDWVRSSLVTPEDKLHAEVKRLRGELSDERAALGEALAELDAIRDARPVPLYRLLLVGLSSLITLAVGLADGTDCRRCGHPRYLHRHHRPGTDCAGCGCRAWTLWGRRG